MALAFFPLYPTDFEADTAHLTLAEDGAYNRLLRLCWRTPGCSIPADREWIYRRMRAATDEDRAAVDAVLNEFFVAANGRLNNARLTREYEKAKAFTDKQRENGKKGGRPTKTLKTNETEQRVGLAKKSSPEPEPEPQSTAVDDAVAEGEKTHREALLTAVGADPVSGLIGPNGTRIGTVADMAEVAKWTDAGISEADQIRIVAERMAQRRAKVPGFAPKSLRYFSDAMSEFAARRDDPLPKPSPRTNTNADAEREKRLAFYRQAGRRTA